MATLFFYLVYQPENIDYSIGMLTENKIIALTSIPLLMNKLVLELVFFYSNVYKIYKFYWEEEEKRRLDELEKEHDDEKKLLKTSLKIISKFVVL